MLRLLRADLLAQLGERHLPVALGEEQPPPVGEELVLRQLEAHAAERESAVLARVGRGKAVLAARSELEPDRVALLVDLQLAGAGQDQLRLPCVARVVDQQVLPRARLGVDVLDVEHHPPRQQGVGERARPHVGASLADEQVDHELAVGLVRGRQCDRVDVEGEPRHGHGQDHHGAEQPGRADADRPKRDDLAVARQASEGEQHAEQEGHRDGDRQERRQQVQEHPQDGRQIGAAGHQHREQARDVIDQQHEREDEQADSRRREHLADDVPVDQPRRGAATGPSAVTRAS